MKLLGDIHDKTWSLVEEENSCFEITIYIGFRDKGKLPASFNNLSFGFKVIDQDEEIFSKPEVLENSNITATDQDYISSFNIDGLIPEREYSVEVWAENNSESFKEQFKFVLPKPLQPFKSWSYDENTYSWTPPVPIPDTENLYIWNEDLQTWKKLF